jgi:transcriptional regulator with XRE-family HTH domain
VLQEHQEFAQRLYQALAAKQMSQSDLAKAVWGKQKDARGYSVARNRDRVSVYLSGRGVPEKENLVKIAKALGVRPEDLAPAVMASRLERENPEVSIVMVAGRPDQAVLRINTVVTPALALKVATVLNDAKAAAAGA